MRDIVKAFRRPPIRPLPVRLPDRNGGFPRLSARGRTASRMAPDVPHRDTTRSWPKALGNRLYGSLSTLLGIRVPHAALPDDDPDKAADPALGERLFWDGGDLVGRAAVVESVTFDGAKPVLTPRRAR